MASREKDEISGIETTGHEWDGIKELNNPLPRWWLWTFYGCIAFALGYMIAYPAWPLVSGATPGLLGYSSRAEFVKEVDSAVSAQAAQREMVKTLPLEEIRNNADLLQFAVAGGRAAIRLAHVRAAWFVELLDGAADVGQADLGELRHVDLATALEHPEHVGRWHGLPGRQGRQALQDAHVAHLRRHRNRVLEQRRFTLARIGLTHDAVSYTHLTLPTSDLA